VPFRKAKFLYNISSPFYEYEVPFSGEAFRSSCQAGASSSACKGSGDRCEQDEECCSRQCVAGRARWYNQKTGKPARNSELLRVLTDLSALKIRGGVHSMGAERSFLKEPRILEGGAVNRTLASPTGSEIGSSRSTECRVERTAAIHIRPTGSTELALGVPLARPWTHYFPIPNVPEICTDTTLAVRAKGDILGHGKYVGVLGENGELLGKLFVTAGDYEAGPSTNACRDGADYCTSVFMADEVVLEGEEEDGLVIPRAQMTEFAADGIVSLGLYVEAENLATEVTIVELSLEFGLGGCFSRRLVRFPGIHRTPDRYTGFVESLTAHHASARRRRCGDAQRDRLPRRSRELRVSRFLSRTHGRNLWTYVQSGRLSRVAARDRVDGRELGPAGRSESFHGRSSGRPRRSEEDCAAGRRCVQGRDIRRTRGCCGKWPTLHGTRTGAPV
jgi:hypothetical protein